MFDFEKLVVYQKAKEFNKSVQDFLANNKHINRTTKDQLGRASLSIMLNIAEGSGRFGKADRCNFFVIARGSVYECVAVLDFLYGAQQIDYSLFQNLYQQAEELSRMLYALIRNLKRV